MAPDRTILHLVKNNYGVHTVSLIYAPDSILYPELSFLLR